jgi:hypothetical protein
MGIVEIVAKHRISRANHSECPSSADGYIFLEAVKDSQGRDAGFIVVSEENLKNIFNARSASADKDKFELDTGWKKYFDKWRTEGLM